MVGTEDDEDDDDDGVCMCVHVCVCMCVCTGSRLCSDTLHLALLQLTDGAPYGVSQFLPRTPITMCDLCFFNRQAPMQTHTDRQDAVKKN